MNFSDTELKVLEADLRYGIRKLEVLSDTPNPSLRNALEKAMQTRLSILYKIQRYGNSQTDQESTEIRSNSS